MHHSNRLGICYIAKRCPYEVAGIQRKFMVKMSLYAFRARKLGRVADGRRQGWWYKVKGVALSELKFASGTKICEASKGGSGGSL